MLGAALLLLLPGAACQGCRRPAGTLEEIASRLGGTWWGKPSSTPEAVRMWNRGLDQGRGMLDYLRSYEQLACPLAEEARMLAIGVLGGKSLLMWSDYLGPKADILGVDIDTTLFGIESAKPGGSRANLRVQRANSTSPAFGRALRAGLAPPRGFDLVVDDGCHFESCQLATFRNVWPYVKPGGLYLVEDTMWTGIPQGFDGKGRPAIDGGKRTRVRTPKFVAWLAEAVQNEAVNRNRGTAALRDATATMPPTMEAMANHVETVTIGRWFAAIRKIEPMRRVAARGNASAAAHAARERHSKGGTVEHRP